MTDETRKARGETAKWVGLGAGAALGSAALAAAVLYATRARKPQPKPSTRLPEDHPEANIPTAPEVTAKTT